MSILIQAENVIFFPFFSSNEINAVYCNTKYNSNMKVLRPSNWKRIDAIQFDRNARTTISRKGFHDIFIFYLENFFIIFSRCYCRWVCTTYTVSLCDFRIALNSEDNQSDPKKEKRTVFIITGTDVLNVTEIKLGSITQN